jgi:hypothetical protein
MKQHTIQIKAEEVKPGTTVWALGHAWTVKSNTLDPIGAGRRDHPLPRRVLNCEVADERQRGKLGAFSDKMSLGFRTDGYVDVIPSAEDLRRALEHHLTANG